MKLRVIASGLTSRGAKVFLDDKELRGCTSLDVSLKVDDCNRAVLRFIPTEVEVEGEFKVETKRHKFISINPNWSWGSLLRRGRR